MRPQDEFMASAEKGQATIEFLTVAVVLGALFLIMPLLGNYQDMTQSAEMASRYVAFEGVVHNPSTDGWKSNAVLSDEVRRRFFNNSTAPIKTGDVASEHAGDRNSLWVDSKGLPLIEDINRDVVVNASVSSKNALAAAVFQGAFNLSKDNYLQATIAVKPRVPEILQNISPGSFQITRKSTILVDAWNANAPARVASTISNAGVLAYPIAPLQVLGDTVGQLPALFLENGMRVNDIQPDVVPCDRLEGGC